MSNCRNSRCYEQRWSRPGDGFSSEPCDKRRHYNRNRHRRYDRSDVMGGRRVPPRGEHCPYKTPRAWEDYRYDRHCH